MKIRARDIRPGNDVRMMDGTWITVRRVTRSADHILVQGTNWEDVSMYENGIWEVRQGATPAAAVTPVDRDAIRAAAAARFTL